YGFQPAETPVIEYEDFVTGREDDNSKESNQEDEAISDVFKLKDKGERNLALRYEFTFQLKRLMQNKKLPYKRYQIGPVFRDEPVSANRVRQITQCDVDIIGSEIKDDAEILALSAEILAQLGIKSRILVNNRKLMNEILEAEGVKKQDLEQALREIDKYDKLPESQVKENLKKLGAGEVLDKIKQGEKFFSQFESYKEILELIRYCSYYGIKVSFSPTIVRGLSYYNRTVFEIKGQGIKETIIAGGSYNFNNQQCVGISFGLERLSVLADISYEKQKTLVVSLNEDKKAIQIAQKLRRQGLMVSVYYGKPSKALNYANSYNIQRVIFVGAKEVQQKKFKVKNMKTGKEKYLTLNKINKKNLVFQKK
ncbi:MAG TPA: HisS family protein, partial [Candidatus Nanoarchaeia archaeon]|nr:HisS family protein [Candidatus Nanoarchaeia archaeon]